MKIEEIQEQVDDVFPRILVDLIATYKLYSSDIDFVFYPKKYSRRVRHKAGDYLREKEIMVGKGRHLTINNGVPDGRITTRMKLVSYKDLYGTGLLYSLQTILYRYEREYKFVDWRIYDSNVLIGVKIEYGGYSFGTLFAYRVSLQSSRLFGRTTYF